MTRRRGLAIVVAHLVSMAAAVDTRAEVHGISEMELQEGSGQTTRVTLPHRWAGPRTSEGLERLYSADLPGFEEGELFAVLIRDVAMNAEVWWNGERLGDGGSLEAPVAQNFHRPLFFPVPAALMGRDGNRLEIRVVAAAHFYGWLGKVDIGPERSLRPEYEADRFWRTTVAQGATVLGVSVAALLAAFWIASRDTVFGWFAATAGLWSIASLNLHLVDIPIPTMPWARGIQLALALAGPCFLVHVHRLLAIEAPRTERALAGACVAVAIAAVLVPDRWFLQAFTAAHVPGLAAALLGFALVVRHLPRFPPLQAAALVLAIGALLVIGIHDTAIQFGGRAGEPRYWNALAAPMFLFGFGTALNARFVASFRRAERMNEELDARVRERERSLATNYARLRELEADRAAAQERIRMMREMHDGLGGRLVEALSVAESPGSEARSVAEPIRGALVDMRLIIGSLDPEVNDLVGVLALARDRLEPGLRRRGVTLEWDIGGIDRIDCPLPPRLALHVLRIVQESFTNVQKHADAGRVGLRTTTDGDEVVLSITDDGRGLAGASRRIGRGRPNLESRAAELGGSIVWEEGDGGRGTRVCLRFPLPKPALST